MTNEEKIKHCKKVLGQNFDPNAKTVYASGCTGLTALPELPNAEYVYARGCTGLTALPELPNAEYVDARGCTGLTALPELPNAEYVDARGCTGLTAGSKETSLFSKSIGSRYAITEYWIEADEIKCGCFTGTLQQFEGRVNSQYPTGIYGDQYRSFIDECKSAKV